MPTDHDNPGQGETGHDDRAHDRRVAARRAIAACIARHNLGRDRRDPAMLASTYHADATILFGPPIAAQAWIGRICTSPATLASYHRTANLLVRVEGVLARSESACIAHVLLPDQGIQRFLCGRYLDHHADRGDGWKIARRLFVHDETIDLPMESGPLASRLLGPPARDYGAREPMDVAVTDPVFAVAYAVDRGDEAALQALLGPGVVVDPRPSGGQSFHMIEGVQVRHGNDGAIVTSEALTIARYSGSGAQEHVRTGRQIDHVVPDGDGWRIASRRIEGGWSGYCPTTAITLPFERGRPDRGDPRYAFWQ